MTDEERAVKAFRKLSKSKKEQLLDSWVDLLDWVAKIVNAIVNIIDIANAILAIFG